MFKNKTMQQNELTNEKVRVHSFLKDMYRDPYFPNHLVDKIKVILLDFCHSLESQQFQNLNTLYTLSHKATKRINELQEEFHKAGSEIETAARESICYDFDTCARAYGFVADVEQLVAPRKW